MYQCVENIASVRTKHWLFHLVKSQTNLTVFSLGSGSFCPGNATALALYDTNTVLIPIIQKHHIIDLGRGLILLWCPSYSSIFLPPYASYHLPPLSFLHSSISKSRFFWSAAPQRWTQVAANIRTADAHLLKKPHFWATLSPFSFLHAAAVQFKPF